MQHHKVINIRGAKEHNLKNINLTLPRDQFIVFTGVSGSGKSSLAFDTIYAEGQRRYVESLSSYARQFLGQMNKPNVEYIEGLSPAISIDQKTTSNNPRSTVATVTEIYDYLRLLYANIGIPHCTTCGKEIKQLTIQEIVDLIMQYEEKTKLMLVAPIIRGKKGRHEKLLESIRKDGYLRVRIDGEIIELSDEVELDKNKKHDIDVVVDRLIMKPGIEGRLADSLETAIKLSDGLVRIVNLNKEEDELISTKFACPEHGIGIEELTPRLFSFNAPFGACETCKGLGFLKSVDPKLVVPNEELTLREGAVDAWTPTVKKEDGYYFRMIESLAEHHGVSMDVPYRELPEEFKQALLYGSKTKIKFYFESSFTKTKKQYHSPFEGVIPNIERRMNTTSSEFVNEKLEHYTTELPCPSCHGKRLKPEVLSVTVRDKNISDLTTLSVTDHLNWLRSCEFSETEQTIVGEVVKEIVSRLQFLQNVGLEYLTLSRRAGTLSGGEAQRIRLATQIGSALVGVLYVLDEPSIGLHQRDNNKLLETLRHLCDIGNTLIVVEHDEDTMEAADMIVDIGPGAGTLGGEIVAQGTLQEIENNPESITGAYLSGRLHIPIPEERRPVDFSRSLTLVGCKENNLKNIDVRFPLSVFTCVTGVSGSGKSSLVNEILFKGCASVTQGLKQRPGDFKEIKGLEFIDKVINIDQSPIGRTPRSNPATYTGLFDGIRDIFALTQESKARGYKKGRFSFNVSGGRCEACKGDGIIKIEMHFLADVYVPCEICKGARYNRETLQIKYKGKNIADVLDMTIEEASEFFGNVPKLANKIRVLKEVGLGYVKLGQPATQLSGGEAQRVKLATELSRKSTGKTLYILDEPTTGLHIADVHKLIKVLQSLTDQGNSVVVIEHNLDVIKSADYIIDLGPEGGVGGGNVVTTGMPEEVAQCTQSYTGQYLKLLLSEQ